jgi:hypothetical protein
MKTHTLDIVEYRDWISKLPSSSIYQEETNLKFVLDSIKCSTESKNRAAQKLEIIREVYGNRNSLESKS